MTYIDYMNQFWRLAAYESFAASEVALYAFLVNECNKFHWKMPFSCPTFHVCNRLRMSKQTLVTARERLAKRKLISFTNGTTRFQPSKYLLLELTEDLSVHLTEDLTLNNKEVDIDKEVISQRTHEEHSMLSIEELEEVLGIASYPMNWPIGMGKAFEGLYDLYNERLELYKGNERFAKIEDGDTLFANNPFYEQAKEDIELLTEAGNE